MQEVSLGLVTVPYGSKAIVHGVEEIKRARFGLSELHIEPRGSLKVVDWIVLDNWYANLKRYCEIFGQAPPHTEIERQE